MAGRAWPHRPPSCRPRRVRRRPLLWLSSLALLGLGVATPALSQTRFEVPGGCGTEAEFRSEIERLTGSTAAAGGPVSLVIEALGARQGGYEMRLTVGDAPRVLRDPECRILFRSAIVITAAASRPASPPSSAPVEPSPPSPAPRPSPSAPGASPPAATPTPPQSPPAATAPASPRASSAPPPSAAPLVTPLPGSRSSSVPPSAAMTTRAPAPVRPAVGSRPNPRPSSAGSALRRNRPGLRARARRGERRGIARRGSEDAERLPVPNASVDSRAGQRATAPVRAASGGARYGLALGLGVSGGVLPDLGATLELGARAEVLPWAVDLSLRYWPERSSSREGRGVDVSALGGRVAVLLRVAPALNVLAGVELNRLEGAGAESVPGRSSAAVAARAHARF